MNKAFVFDMDGVLVNSEKTWLTYGDDFFVKLFGQDIRQQMGEVLGLSADQEYELAKKYGFRMDKTEFDRRFDEQAKIIYEKAEITPRVDELMQFLAGKGFKMGVVSASWRSWVDTVLTRIPSSSNFECIISLHEKRHNLHPKPAPDGYLKAMELLGSDPSTTIALEDSNPGIAAAKAAGVFTIGFTPHLIKGYEQKGADVYANNIDEVKKIVEEFLGTNDE